MHFFSEIPSSINKPSYGIDQGAAIAGNWWKSRVVQYCKSPFTDGCVRCAECCGIKLSIIQSNVTFYLPATRTMKGGTLPLHPSLVSTDYPYCTTTYTLLKNTLFFALTSVEQPDSLTVLWLRKKSPTRRLLANSTHNWQWL
jgi:hypothetical protein